jgi:hypothetical protein
MAVRRDGRGSVSRRTYDGGVLDVLAGLLPTVAVGALFYVVIRAILHADRRERAALARMEAEERLAKEHRADPS